MDRDEIKLLTQIKDVLPSIKKQVKEIEEFAKKFRQSIAAEGEPVPKISLKGLEKKLNKLKEAETTLYKIVELNLRLESFFEGKRSKKLSETQKQLTGLSNILEKSVSDIQTALADLSKKKLPKHLKTFGNTLFKALVKGGLKGKQTKGYYIDITSNVMTFVYYLEVQAKTEKGAATVYIVLSKALNLNNLKPSRIRLSVFNKVFKRPPYDWKNYREVTTTIEATQIIITILAALGYGDLLASKKTGYR
jgi:hypothetical protein